MSRMKAAQHHMSKDKIASEELVNSATLTRRDALKGAAGTLALTSFAGYTRTLEAADISSTPNTSRRPLGTTEKPFLRVATCQFPVSSAIEENSRYIQRFMHEAAGAGAHLLHTSELSLAGYAGVDIPDFHRYDWDLLRKETRTLRQLSEKLDMWLVLGSSHFLDIKERPTNCLYLINPEGSIVDRYDKCFPTGFEKASDDPFYAPDKGVKYPYGDLAYYSPGDHLVTRDIGGVRIGLAICYDLSWPQLYIAYRERGVTVMLHSFHNARLPGKNCLQTLEVRQVPTRCADNRMWAVSNNSSAPYSEWGSFVARPDATIPKQLPINTPGLLTHDFPDGLSKTGWYHNYRPMKKRDDEVMHAGTLVNHPRRLNYQSEA